MALCPAISAAARATRIDPDKKAATAMQRIDRLISSILGVDHQNDRPGRESIEPVRQPLYRALIEGVDPTPAIRIAIGRAWILVRSASGAGLAFAPRWPAAI